MTEGEFEFKKVLEQSFNQAIKGKGKERHGDGKAFVEQPIFWIEREFKSFQLGQAVKKAHESQSLPLKEAVAELQGAIVYIACHIMSLKEAADKE